jgi:hypothetical protein
MDTGREVRDKGEGQQGHSREAEDLVWRTWALKDLWRAGTKG